MKLFKWCQFCSKAFYKKPRHSLIVWKKTKFCSKECYGKNLIGKPSKRKGLKHSSETLLKITEANRKNGLKHRGEYHHSWKGGKIRTNRGYVYILSPNHPYREHHNYVAEHRLTMEKHLGRYLKPQEKVHHINNIKDDNRIENLMLFTKNGYHSAFHRWGSFKEHYI